MTAEAAGRGAPDRNLENAEEERRVRGNESDVPCYRTAVVGVKIRCCPSCAMQHEWRHPSVPQHACADDDGGAVRRSLQEHSEVTLRRADTGQSSNNPAVALLTAMTASTKPPQ